MRRKWRCSPAPCPLRSTPGYPRCLIAGHLPLYMKHKITNSTDPLPVIRVTGSPPAPTPHRAEGTECSEYNREAWLDMFNRFPAGAEEEQGVESGGARHGFGPVGSPLYAQPTPLIHRRATSPTEAVKSEAVKPLNTPATSATATPGRADGSPPLYDVRSYPATAPTLGTAHDVSHVAGAHTPFTTCLRAWL